MGNSDLSRDQEYNALLEQFLRDMNSMEGTRIAEKVGDALAGLCRFLRVEKLTGLFYNGLSKEKAGQGEEYTCYDTGNPSEEQMHNRIVIDTLTVAHILIYQAVGAEPWTDLEISRINLIQRTLVIYISRLRLEREVERYIYYDADGYYNVRHFFRELQRRAMTDRLKSKVAICYNLKQFSAVNQKIGRHAGSAVMKKHYEKLLSLLSDGGVIARLGGDNFVLLCDMSVLPLVEDYLQEATVVYDEETNGRVTVQTTAGAYVIPKDFVFRNPGDIMDKVLVAAQEARQADGDDLVYYREETINNNIE